MTVRERLRAILREPLVHFLAAGAVIFAVFSAAPPDPGERRIVLDEPALTRLVERFTETYRRAPSPKELQGLINDAVADQVYYREGLRLGLDRDDDVVVRRMRTKMLALATSDAETRQPGDAELQAMLDRDPARYAEDAVTSFDQVWLGPDKPDVRAGAAPALARLNSGAAPADVGRPVALPLHFDRASTADIGAQLGDEFATVIKDLPAGQWRGPIGSGLGLHLVRVTARVAPGKPTLATVRQRVENDWRAQAIAKAEDEAYRKLLAGYQVEIAKVK